MLNQFHCGASSLRLTIVSGLFADPATDGSRVTATLSASADTSTATLAIDADALDTASLPGGRVVVPDPDGGEARRAATVTTGVDAFRWCPDGRRVVFVSWVNPALKGAKAQAAAHNKADMMFAHMMIPHHQQAIEIARPMLPAGASITPIAEARTIGENNNL